MFIVGRNYKIPVIFGMIFFLMGAFVFAGELRDGVYFGKSFFAEVEVTISGGEIKDIEITSHAGDPGYEEMIEPLRKAIIETRSTDVDAVTGATISSRGLKDAVNDALEKAGNR